MAVVDRLQQAGHQRLSRGGIRDSGSIQRPRTPSSALAGPSTSRAARRSRTSSPAGRCGPSGYGSRTIRTVAPRDVAERRSSRRVLRPCQRTRPGVVDPRAAGGHASAGMKNIPTVAIVPLDRSGHVIATTQSTTPPTVPPSLTWMAPNAVTRSWPLSLGTVPYHHPGYHGRTDPGPGVCELAQSGLPALHPQWGHTIAWISPVHDALGEVFVSCIDAAYYLHGWPLQVAVLLDGHRRGRFCAQFPARGRPRSSRTSSASPPGNFQPPRSPGTSV